MVSNFDFLKNKDKKLYDIMIDAEKLYRDGYFVQTIGQVRKFGEIVSKNVLGVRRTTEENFSDVLATLSDILGDNQTDKEFIDDLYFIKQKGNLAVHDSARELGGDVALECLQRAYEVSISYALKNGWGNKKLLNSIYNVNTLMTGKNEKITETLSEQYEKKKEEFQKKENKYPPVKKEKTPAKQLKTKPKPKTSKKKETKKIEKKENEELTEFELYIHVLIGVILISMMIGILIFILPL